MIWGRVRRTGNRLHPCYTGEVGYLHLHRHLHVRLQGRLERRVLGQLNLAGHWLYDRMLWQLGRLGQLNAGGQYLIHLVGDGGLEGLVDLRAERIDDLYDTCGQ